MQQLNAVGKNQAIADSIINNLRIENDLVIAYAVENFAWARSINYKIIAKKDNEWKGYQYDVSLMKQNPSHTIKSTNVNNSACDSLLNYLMQTKAWIIKGDTGENFCTNGSTNCNINDASSARLWIITKRTVFNPSYYAPEFYEKCCPDKYRALFLSVITKVDNIVGNNQGAEE